MQCRCCSTNSLNRLYSRVPQSHWNALPKATHHQGFSGHSTASLFHRVRGNIKKEEAERHNPYLFYGAEHIICLSRQLTGSLRGTFELVTMLLLEQDKTNIAGSINQGTKPWFFLPERLLVAQHSMKKDHFFVGARMSKFWAFLGRIHIVTKRTFYILILNFWF